MTPARTPGTTADRLVDDYLQRLRAATRELPPDRREELVGEIAEHVSAARAAGQGDDERRVREVLDRLGPPAVIVDAARDGSAARPSQSLLRELSAVLLLTVGSVLLPLLGWVAGAVLLWTSRLWTSREKLLATLVVPGGLLPGLLALSLRGQSCSSSSMSGPGGRTITTPEVCDGWAPPLPLGVLALLVLLGAPVVVAVVLWQRARARAAGTEPAPYGRGAPDLPHRAAVPVLAVLVALALALPVVAWTALGGRGSGADSVQPLVPVPVPSPPP